MGRGAELLELLGGEDVNGNQVNLGVSVLAGLVRVKHELSVSSSAGYFMYLGG